MRLSILAAVALAGLGLTACKQRSIYMDSGRSDGAAKPATGPASAPAPTGATTAKQGARP